MPSRSDGVTQNMEDKKYQRPRSRCSKTMPWQHRHGKVTTPCVITATNEGADMKTEQTSSRLIAVALLSGAMVSGMAPDVSAGTLLNDTFNTADNADINVNLARQTGTLAPIAYVANDNYLPPFSINGNALLATAPGDSILSASPNYNFTTFNNYSISVDIKPLVTGSSWDAFIIGTIKTSNFFDHGTGTVIFFNAAGDGSGQVIDGGGGGNIPFNASLPDANGYWHLRFDISTAGADILTGNATVNVYVQSEPVITFTRTSAYANNYISLMSYPQGSDPNPNQTKWDNLMVTTVPEPATLALLVAGGLALGRRRRG